MEERIPVLFDTDIGSDIDDAVALAYLLQEPRCELLGITTVTGEPQERARLADAICRAAGREGIPIHSGVQRPLFIGEKQPLAPQKSVLPRWPHRESFPPGTAVPFLQQTIRSRPGEITLLAVGPFTNVGVLFAMDPELPRLLRRLVIMGGVFLPDTPRHEEWNASLDPHASALLFNAEGLELIAFGLDVTLRCRLPAEECRTRFRSGALDLVADMAEVWFTAPPNPAGDKTQPPQEITFHDPLAAVCLFHPDICRYERGMVRVEPDSPAAGTTHFEPAADGRHQIAVEVDPARFFEHYFRAFSRAPEP